MVWMRAVDIEEEEEERFSHRQQGPFHPL